MRATPSRRGRAAALGLGEESRPVPSSGMTGGSPASEREKGGKGRSGLGRELGRRKGNGPRERKRRKEGKKKVGRAEREREKEMIFQFRKRFKLFQFKFKLKNLNLT